LWDIIALPSHQRLEVLTAVRDAKDEHVAAHDAVDDDMPVDGKAPAAGA